MNTHTAHESPVGTSAVPCAIVVPVFNEAASLRGVVDEWMPVWRDTLVDFAVLIIDDGSVDSTPEVCAALAQEYSQIRVIRQANAGHGQACIRGYREALALHAEWVFQIDSDGQCDPQYFPALWAARTRAVAAYGIRVRREDGKDRERISAICRYAVRWVTGVKVPDANVPYRLMRSSILQTAIEDIPKIHLSNILVSVLLYATGLDDIHHVPIVFRDRTGGEAAVKWRGFVRRGWELIGDLYRTRIWVKSRIPRLVSEWQAEKDA